MLNFTILSLVKTFKLINNFEIINFFKDKVTIPQHGFLAFHQNIQHLIIKKVQGFIISIFIGF